LRWGLRLLWLLTVGVLHGALHLVDVGCRHSPSSSILRSIGLRLPTLGIMKIRLLLHRRLSRPRLDELLRLRGCLVRLRCDLLLHLRYDLLLYLRYELLLCLRCELLLRLRRELLLYLRCDLSLYLSRLGYLILRGVLLLCRYLLYIHLHRRAIRLLVLH